MYSTFPEALVTAILLLDSYHGSMPGFLTATKCLRDSKMAVHQRIIFVQDIFHQIRFIGKQLIGGLSDYILLIHF